MPANLAAGWSGAPTAILQLTSNMTSMAAKDTVFLIATATDSTTAFPTGSVTFTTGAGTALGSAQLLGSNGIATATLAVTGSHIGLDPVSQTSQTVTATYKESSATVTAHVTLNALAASVGTTPLISGSTNAGSFQQVYAPGMILADLRIAACAAGLYRAECRARQLRSFSLHDGRSCGNDRRRSGALVVCVADAVEHPDPVRNRAGYA